MFDLLSEIWASQMRAEAVCDACFGLMVREDRRRLRLPPYSILYPACAVQQHLRLPTKRSTHCCLLRTSQDNDGDDDENDLDRDVDEQLELAPPTKPRKVRGVLRRRQTSADDGKADQILGRISPSFREAGRILKRFQTTIS